MIDIVEIKKAIDNGELVVYIQETWQGAHIMIGDVQSGEIVKVGEISKESSLRRLTDGK